MKSNIIKRSVKIDGRSTSISLENAFWEELKRIAAEKNITTYRLVTDISVDSPHFNLSSAIRLFVLEHARRNRRAKAET
ncbi:ribbon-helix-helix domain-containing protein [Labrys monachus]|uniref:DNA-binding ribbon-helix-helix protein n=1 Tax=Labrys monachus TaxID=217067 RepID=A0ABU0FKR3_9HYPH|nr:ribbon-helix-helix domain-containing protein [Labrys monachus]MDQ0395200.1 putative DNA-binding ribbon-helix-helix protein [Labrys monachus]